MKDMKARGFEYDLITYSSILEAVGKIDEDRRGSKESEEDKCPVAELPSDMQKVPFEDGEEGACVAKLDELGKLCGGQATMADDPKFDHIVLAEKQKFIVGLKWVYWKLRLGVERKNCSRINFQYTTHAAEG
ncbi:hypothetical protein CRYUN_Cryun34aG0081200 [Craigia yunnanensis]